MSKPIRWSFSVRARRWSMPDRWESLRATRFRSVAAAVAAVNRAMGGRADHEARRLIDDRFVIVAIPPGEALDYDGPAVARLTFGPEAQAMTAETTEVEWFTAMQVGDDWRRVLVTAEVTGRYRPATWGYAGGDPPEGPEVTITRIDVEEDASEARPLPAMEIDPKTLDRAVREGLEDRAADLAEERRARRTYGDKW